MHSQSIVSCSYQSCQKDYIEATGYYDHCLNYSATSYQVLYYGRGLISAVRISGGTAACIGIKTAHPVLLINMSLPYPVIPFVTWCEKLFFKI